MYKGRCAWKDLHIQERQGEAVEIDAAFLKRPVSERQAVGGVRLVPVRTLGANVDHTITPRLADLMHTGTLWAIGDGGAAMIYITSFQNKPFFNI